MSELAGVNSRPCGVRSPGVGEAERKAGRGIGRKKRAPGRCSGRASWCPNCPRICRDTSAPYPLDTVYLAEILTSDGDIPVRMTPSNRVSGFPAERQLMRHDAFSAQDGQTE